MTRNDFVIYVALKFLAIEDLTRFALVYKKSLSHLSKLCAEEYDALREQIRPYVKIPAVEDTTSGDSLVAKLHAIPNAVDALASYDVTLNSLSNIRSMNNSLGTLDSAASLAKNYEAAKSWLLALPGQLRSANVNPEANTLLITETQDRVDKVGLLSFLEQLALVTDPKEQHLYLGILLIQNPELFSLVLYMQHYITSEQKFSDYCTFAQNMINAGYTDLNVLLGINLDEIIERTMMQKFALSPEIFAMGDFAGFMRQLARTPQLTNMLLLKILPFLLSGIKLWHHYKSDPMVAGDNRLCHWWRFFIIAVNHNPEIVLILSKDVDRLLDLFMERSLICALLRQSSYPRLMLWVLCSDPVNLIHHNVNRALQRHLFDFDEFVAAINLNLNLAERGLNRDNQDNDRHRNMHNR